MSRTAQPGPRRPFSWRLTWLTVLVAALVFLVALGSRRSFANLSPSRTLLDASIILGDLFVILGVVLLAEVGLLVYVWISHMRRRRAGIDHTQERLPSSWSQRLLATLAALLLFAVLIGVAARNRTDDSGGGLGLVPPVNPLPLGSDQPAAETFVIHWWFFIGLAVIGLSGLLVAVFRRRRQRPARETESAAAEREDLLAVVEASLDGLEQDPDPRRAVIAAYASMEQTLARHGLARRPSEAPLEYLQRWTCAVRVSRSPAEALTRLYELARFSLNVVDENMKQQATTALLTLRHELGEKTV